MKAPVWKMALSAVATAALATQGLLGLATPANAVTNQNASVEWIAANQSVTQTGSDGSLYKKRCAEGQDSSDTFTKLSSTDGTSLATVNDPTSSTSCATDVIAGQDGKFFTLETGKITGYDSSGVRMWVANTGTCDMWGTPANLVTSGNIKLGADGNLYALKGSPMECSSQVTTQLIKIDTAPSGGSVTTLTNLTGAIDDGATAFKTLFAYKSGVALYELSNYSTGAASVRYFDLTGAELLSRKLILTGIVSDAGVQVSHNGEALYIENGSNYDCSYTYATIYIVSPTTGVKSEIANACSSDEGYWGVTFTLDGYVQLTSQRQSDYHRLHTIYSPTGTVVYQQDVSTLLSGGTYQWATSDGYGNTLHTYNVSDAGRQYFAFVLVNNTGTVTSIFDARNEPNASSTSLTLQGTAKLVDGYVYANVCQGWCSNWNTPSLYKIGMTTVGIDYPRAGTLSKSPLGKLHYVALGDSYSSGEGNPDFHTGTATPGVNACHRSDSAYPNLLASDATLNLDLYDFRACSGATTDNVINGQHNEGSQLNALNTETDIVTISIGGNNVGFKPFMVACLTPGQTCAQGSTEYNNTKSYINNTLASKVSELLDDIADKIGANTKVLVVGYPMLVQEFSQSWSNCILTSQGDRDAIMEMASLMNGKLAATIDSYNNGDARFHYVTAMGESSPFEGHDMCSAESDNYIIEWNLGDPEEYIAHPDVDGHLAYAEIIKDYIVTHNLTTSP